MLVIHCLWSALILLSVQHGIFDTELGGGKLCGKRKPPSCCAKEELSRSFIVVLLSLFLPYNQCRFVVVHYTDFPLPLIFIIITVGVSELLITWVGSADRLFSVQISRSLPQLLSSVILSA